MSKTGLNYAEAKAAIARSTDSYASANLHNANARNAGLYGNAIDQYYKDQKFGSKRSGAGGTYIDQETGKEISTPTNAVTTQNQKAIMADERVKPLIQDLIKNDTQFATAKQQGALGLQRASNYLFGTDYEKPNQYAQAQQDISLAPESMLKAYGLNVTDKSLDTMRDAVKRVPGESNKGRERRLLGLLKSMSQNQQEARNAQSQGIDVTPQQPPVAQGFNGNPDLPPQQQGQQQPQIQATKQLGDSEYVQINGQWFHK
jgi:hypothetical protein